MGAEAATAHSSACNAEITKSDFKNPSKTFFSQETNFLRATQHASAILLRGVFLLRTTSKCERASEVLRIPRDARATVSTKPPARDPGRHAYFAASFFSTVPSVAISYFSIGTSKGVASIHEAISLDTFSRSFMRTCTAKSVRGRKPFDTSRLPNG